ncbi:hypothetical protein AAG570_009929 [Ranatra chinensis]|uniref:DM13 domain-containing protein n=1 Tax=Ranatra chinensis TaxID=642074 RepID=A0ABD0YQI5_9HEMI
MVMMSGTLFPRVLDYRLHLSRWLAGCPRVLREPPVLKAYNRTDVILRLPHGKKLKDIKWLSVWCRRFTDRSRGRRTMGGAELGGKNNEEKGAQRFISAFLPVECI